MQGVWLSRRLEVSATGNRCVLCFGRGTGDEMGRNEVSVFVYNECRWGDMGRNRLSPLEMGTKGRGEGWGA